MIKRNLPIIVAILLPLIVVGAVALSLYLPTKNINPEYTVVFVINNQSRGYYEDSFRYVVSDNRVKKVEIPLFEKDKSRIRVLSEDQKPKLYTYNFENKELKEILPDEIGTLGITKSGNISPEGYTVEYSYNRSNTGVFEIFGGYSRDYGWKITENNTSIFEKMSVLGNSYRNVEVLGWTK